MKKTLLALALIAVPGSGVAYGLYLIYQASKKKPKTYEEWITEMKAEANKSMEEK